MATFRPPTQSLVATQRDVIFPNELINPQQPIPVTQAPTAGDLNPLNRFVLSKFLNVNTTNRAKISAPGNTAPSLSSRSTNCLLNLVGPIRDVISMSLQSIVIPSRPYAISPSRHSDTLWVLKKAETMTKVGEKPKDSVCVRPANLSDRSVLPHCDGYEWHSVTIPSGNYEFGELEALLSSDQVGIELKLDHKSCSFGMRVQGNKVKAVAFATDKPVEGSLGWIMGFRDRYYDFDSTYPAVERPLPLGCPTFKGCDPSTYHPPECPTTDCTAAEDDEMKEHVVHAESTFSLFGASYFMLCIDDFQSNVDQAFLPEAGAAQQTDRIGARQNALARIDFELGDDRCSLKLSVTDSKRIYFGPVTLEKLKVMLIDEHGNQVDLNNSDFTFCLELETLYKY